MSFTADDVKRLREQTSAGMMDCKKALTETKGDFEAAITWLREKGIASAAKRSGRIATEGSIATYIHMGGKLGVLVEVNCETDFVARGEAFQTLCKDICLQVCSASPRWVRIEDVPKEAIDAELEIYKIRARETGKPEKMLDKIAEGMLKKWYVDMCLMEQHFVKDPDKTIEQLCKEMSSKVGEKIDVRRFVRFQLGEGLEKKQSNLAEEVAEALAQSKGN